jgi:adenosine deaminase
MRGRPAHGLISLLLMVCLSGPASADEASAAKRFEAAKRDEPSLLAFLLKMPKGGDLHVHPGGSVYAEYALDAAIRGGYYYDPKETRFYPQSAAGRLPAADLLRGEAGQYLSQFLDAASMRGWRYHGGSGHDHFFRTFDIAGTAQDAMSRVDVIAEYAARSRDQNIQYAELMFGVAPGSAYSALWKDLPPADDHEKLFEAIRPRLPAWVEAARREMDRLDAELARRLKSHAPVSSARAPITLRYIVAASRLAPDNLFCATLAAGMALVKADPRAVSINILAPEDHPYARTHFDKQMALIDFLWSRLGRPNITLHAGELTPDISPVEPMRERIRKSVTLGHAKRIGHGVSIGWERDLGGLFREMRSRGVSVEVCLSSNDGILGVKGDRHPFNLYRRNGIPVSLNTDDEGVSRSTLTMEFVRAVRAYGLSYGDIKELARNSLEYSFLPGRSLYRNRRYDRLDPLFAAVRRPKWSPTPAAARLMAQSDKLRVQVRLERAFAEFEK